MVPCGPAAAAAAVVAAALAAVAFADAPEDQVKVLPDYGAPATRHFTGFSDATPDGQNKLFYYFVEADIGSGSPSTPLLVWLNGGPGASSMMGLFAENLGPQKMATNSTLLPNPDRVTKKYHLMAVDNPVGAGYSFTSAGAYVGSEEDMRRQFVHALRGFFKKHPEYARNPLWITGESYAGKYVPNIGYELAVHATELPLQGIIVGNGMLNETASYRTLGALAFAAGIIDENLLKEVRRREQECIARIRSGWELAGDFCENVTVRWLYTGPSAAAGQLFYYDVGMPDAKELDVITDSLGTYLNRPDVRQALHVGSATWQSADETGPVAQALRSDFTHPSATVIAQLLESGKQAFFYNGVRDVSSCNHIANLESLLALRWSGAHGFASSTSRPWPETDNVLGHVRGFRNLRFATVMRTGHLVPTVVPEAFSTMLDMAIEGSSAVDSHVVV